MDTFKGIGGIMMMLFGVAVIGVIIWVLFWVANGIMWLSGTGGEALLSELFLRDAGTLTRVIIYLLEFEWIYGLFYFLALEKTLGSMDDGEPDLPVLLGGILMTIAVIVVYDPRIAHYLPHFMESAVVWLQTSCNARLVGGISMMNVDFSGTITDPVYYSLFDFIIMLSGGFWIIAQLYLKKN
ncbi:MAG: hypothetical protein K2H98_07295 [Duncaniella sp.]|nr:hypothetical protein [Duncaniella sp.]